MTIELVSGYKHFGLLPLFVMVRVRLANDPELLTVCIYSEESLVDGPMKPSTSYTGEAPAAAASGLSIP